MGSSKVSSIKIDLNTISQQNTLNNQNQLINANSNNYIVRERDREREKPNSSIQSPSAPYNNINPNLTRNTHPEKKQETRIFTQTANTRTKNNDYMFPKKYLHTNSLTNTGYNNIGVIETIESQHDFNRDREMFDLDSARDRVNSKNSIMDFEKINIDKEKDNNSSNNSNSSSLIYNGPKKDNFTMRISSREKNHDATPLKISKNDKSEIKNQIGKYYNKALISQTNYNLNQQQHHQNQNLNHNIHSDVSPKSHNYSVSDKIYTSKEKKMNEIVNSNSNINIRNNMNIGSITNSINNSQKNSGNSYSQSFQMKYNKK